MKINIYIPILFMYLYIHIFTYNSYFSTSIYMNNYLSMIFIIKYIRLEYLYIDISL